MVYVDPQLALCALSMLESQGLPLGALLLRHGWLTLSWKISMSDILIPACIFFLFLIYLLIMLLQLSLFRPFTQLHPAHPLPPTFPHYSSCPWVILISSLASTFPTLFLPSPCLFSTYHLCYLFSVPSPLPLPLPY